MERDEEEWRKRGTPRYIKTTPQKTTKDKKHSACQILVQLCVLLETLRLTVLTATMFLPSSEHMPVAWAFHTCPNCPSPARR